MMLLLMLIVARVCLISFVIPAVKGSLDLSNLNISVIYLDNEINVLKHRLKSLEQSVWKFNDDNERWTRCNRGPCHCDPPFFSVECSRISVDSIPEQQTIPTDTLTLNVASNEIHSIHPNTFKHIPRLIQLDFSNNYLEYLPARSFDGLEGLRHLHLQRNQLETVPQGIFKRLTKLETLDISENLLQTWDAWEGLGSLISLQLSSNHISEWQGLSGSLSKLVFLDLSGNDIQHLQNFPDPDLKILRLNSNRIKFINPQCFQHLKNLERLYLNRNQLGEIHPSTFTFNGLRTLKFIDLSENQLQNITAQYWQNLVSLETLEIRRNFLENIHSDSFGIVPYLTRLVLSGNNIDTIDKSSLDGLKSLSTLILSNNMIQKLDPSIFNFTTKLTQLYLDNNMLEVVELDSLEFLPSLKSLKLGKNSWICDCNATYLSYWILDNPSIIEDQQDIKCEQPKEFSGHLLTSLEHSQRCRNLS